MSFYYQTLPWLRNEYFFLSYLFYHNKKFYKLHKQFTCLFLVIVSFLLKEMHTIIRMQVCLNQVIEGAATFDECQFFNQFLISEVFPQTSFLQC